MAGKRVIFIMSNAPEQDIRVRKESEALRQAGYLPSLMYWDREGTSRQPEKMAGYERAIRFGLRAPSGILVLCFLPLWWAFIFCHLLVKKWDIAHSLNFHAIVPCLLAGRLKGKPVIYEVFDVYSDHLMLPRMIRATARAIDRLLMRLVDAVILVDAGQDEEFGGIPNSRIVPIYDSPPDTLKKIDTGREKNPVFTLFYGGSFYKARGMNLDQILSAVEGADGVKLVISGYGDQVEEIKARAGKSPDKLEFLGFISHDEVYRRSRGADLLIVARNAAIPQHRYNCGSTLLRAMMCGRPILVNKDTATAAKVHAANCGLSVDAYNVGEIREAILKLRDSPELCRELGENARRAYEDIYDWSIMEQRLVALYRELTGGEEAG